MNATDKKQKLEIAQSLRRAALLYGKKKLRPEEVKSKIIAVISKHELTKENAMFFDIILEDIGQWFGIPDHSSASLWNVLIDVDVEY
jgi:hypothetical protein